MQNIALLKKSLYIALTLSGALPFDARAAQNCTKTTDAQTGIVTTTCALTENVDAFADRFKNDAPENANAENLTLVLNKDIEISMPENAAALTESVVNAGRDAAVNGGFLSVDAANGGDCTLTVKNIKSASSDPNYTDAIVFSGYGGAAINVNFVMENNDASSSGAGTVFAALGNAVFNGTTAFKDNKSGLLFFAAGDTDFNSVKYANAVDAGEALTDYAKRQYDNRFENNAATIPTGVFSVNGGKKISFAGRTLFKDNTLATNGESFLTAILLAQVDGSFSMARTDFVGNRITADNITDEAEGYGVVHSGALSGNFTGETTFQDNVFHIKTATNGGAVYGGAMANARSLNFANATFTGNKITADNVRGAFKALGGAYAALESSENVFGQDAVFENNQIDVNTGDALGGGLYAAENSTTVFDASATFKNNSVKTASFGRADGGGLYAANSASVTFNGSTRFEENSADAGGAIAAFGKLEFNKTNAGGAYDNIFLNNRATGQGGAIYGGGLIASEGKLELFVIKGGTLFDGNTVLKESYDSQLMGGAVGLLGLELDAQFGSKTVFQNNAIERTVAAGTDASIWGGALASFTKSTTFNGYAEFTDNKITADWEERAFGGAAFGTVGDWTFKGSAIFDSNAISVGGMQQNGLVGGGALAFAGGTHKFEKGNDPKNENTVLFKNNEISMDLAKNSGSSLTGGALIAETGASVTFEGKTDFIGNKITIKNYDDNTGYIADAYGGAIYAGNGSLSGSVSESGSKIVFNDAVSFNNNGISTVVSGNLFGGAVSVSDSSTIEFNGTAAFYNNSVSAFSKGLVALGGAMNSDGAATNFKKGATFVGNKISVNMGEVAYGGAVYAETGATFGRGTAQGENYETRFINNAIEVGTVMEEINALGGGALGAADFLTFAGASTFDGNKIILRDAEDGASEIYAYGGAIYNTINTAATTTTFGGKATFANNTVEVGGKADADGKATAAGGAMFITSEVGITVGGASLSFAQGAEFINNHVSGGMASIGGALVSVGLKDVSFGTKDSGGTVRFDNNYVPANNAAIVMGGAFYEDSNGEMNFYGDAFFTNNRIDVNNVLSEDGDVAGGALAALTDTVNFERDATFGNNYIKVGGSVVENTRIAGGAMAYFGEGELTFANGATFTNNRVEAANGVGKGGALYVVVADVYTPSPPPYHL